MMLTEEEAKTKWCPFVRAMLTNIARPNIDIFGPAVATVNSRQVPEGETRCIASGCMAWRWGKGTIIVEYPLHPGPGWTKIGETKAGAGVFQKVDDAPRPSEARGYCGLARLP